MTGIADRAGVRKPCENGHFGTDLDASSFAELGQAVGSQWVHSSWPRARLDQHQLGVPALDVKVDGGSRYRRARDRAGTKIRYALSEAATVALRFERAVAGRRSCRRCRAVSTLGRGRRCRRWVTAASLRRVANAGANRVAFSGRTGRPVSYTHLTLPTILLV